MLTYSNISRYVFNIRVLYYVAVMSTVYLILFFNNTSQSRWPIAKFQIQDHTAPSHNNSSKIVRLKSRHKHLETKYILLWTNPSNFPFVYFGKGKSAFVSRKCEYNNCFVTCDRRYLGHHREFDVVAFNGPQLMEVLSSEDLPKQRSVHQKFVYANIEAAANYPICSNSWDNFFNWTWTYKLNSDAVWGYFVVKNSSGIVVAPSPHVDWINTENMFSIDEPLKIKLKSKKKAAAWLVSNCQTISEREKFVDELRLYLNYYNLDVDIYGLCGSFTCSKESQEDCLQIVERDYYFYLAFENALSEDYVTEKILNALNHYTVPVVYGGANYSRFLPPGSYLNACELGAKHLANKIYQIMQNQEEYHNFFRWRKYYSFHLRHENPETDDYCRFCAMINDREVMKRQTIYHDLSEWWTSDKICANLTS